MKVTFVVAGLLSLGLITSSPASELKEELGGTVENGGNSAYCDPWQLFGRGQHVYLPPNNGPAVYMLDYAHAIAEGAELADFDWMPRGGWPAERDRLERTLDGASPVLAEGFREFAVSTEQIHPSAAVPEARRRWIPYSEPDIVELIPGYAPPSCQALLYETQNLHLGGAAIGFHGYNRAVTRRERNGSIRYVFQPELLSYMESTAPLQYSMLLTHEWLWDFTRSGRVNFAANVFLHSRELRHLRPEEVAAKLRALGLKF